MTQMSERDIKYKQLGSSAKIKTVTDQRKEK
jgi:hypothetical protein